MEAGKLSWGHFARDLEFPCEDLGDYPVGSQLSLEELKKETLHF